jgi:hypothetical protein
MFVSDHPPPHFHAYYESNVAVIAIETGKITVGRLPPRIARLVEEWRLKYIAELMAVWAVAERGETSALGRIPGLGETK